MLSDESQVSSLQLDKQSLSAPFGARCFLTGNAKTPTIANYEGLNSPFGARCFLTGGLMTIPVSQADRLNAPFGARCFLTGPIPNVLKFASEIKS